MQQIAPSTAEADSKHDHRDVTPAEVPHTQIHTLGRRAWENVQDVIISILMILLLVLSLQALWRLATAALLGDGTTAQLLSEVIFVLILTEVYRLLIYYLQEHRISVALAIEVAIVSTLREIILKGAHEFEWPQLCGLSLLLVVLGGLLATERWMGRLRKTLWKTVAR